MQLSVSPEKHHLSKDQANWFCEPQYTGRAPAHNKVKGIVNKAIISPGKLIEDPVNDSSNGYPLGKSALPNIGERIVELLCTPYFKTNRNVTCDNIFTTSTKLINSGLSHCCWQNA